MSVPEYAWQPFVGKVGLAGDKAGSGHRTDAGLDPPEAYPVLGELDFSGGGTGGCHTQSQAVLVAFGQREFPLNRHTTLIFRRHMAELAPITDHCVCFRENRLAD